MQESPDESGKEPEGKSKRKETTRDRSMRGRASFQPDTRPSYPSIEVKPQSAEPAKMWAEAAQAKKPEDKQPEATAWSWGSQESKPETEAKSWREEAKPTPPPTEEVQRQARTQAEERAEFQAQAQAELAKPALEPEEEDEEETEAKPTKQRPKTSIEPPVTAEAPSQTAEEVQNTEPLAEKIEPEPASSQEAIPEESQPQEPSSEQAADTHEAVALTASEAETFKQIARELQEQGVGTSEFEPPEQTASADYLRRIAEEGTPQKAEEETIADNDLTEVRNEADQALQNLEHIDEFDDLLKQAAQRVGNKNLSDDELNDLVNNLVPIRDEPHAGGGGMPPLPPHGGGGGGGGGSSGPNMPPIPGMPNAPDTLTRLARLNPYKLSRLSAAERVGATHNALFLAIGAGLAGYFIGKGVGERRAERRLEPRLLEQEKVNKEQTTQILDGQQRINSLERIRERQQKELAENQQRTPIQSEAIAPAAAAHGAPERPEPAVQPEVTQPETMGPPKILEKKLAEGEAAAPAQAAMSSEQTIPRPEAPGPAPLEQQATPSYESIERAPPAVPAETLPDTATIATMAIPELLNTAKGITINGQNVEQAYQSHEIDEGGLRRVIAEDARGGSPERVLAQERRVTELRRARSPEYMRASTTGSIATGGGGAGLFTQSENKTEQRPDHLLPAYDHEQYPSSTPQHLLPTQDQETITKKHHRMVAAGATLIGLGAGILLALLLL